MSSAVADRANKEYIKTLEHEIKRLRNEIKSLTESRHHYVNVVLSELDRKRKNELEIKIENITIDKENLEKTLKQFKKTSRMSPEFGGSKSRKSKCSKYGKKRSCKKR